MKERNVGIPIEKMVRRHRQSEDIIGITYRWSLTGKQVTVWFTDRVPDSTDYVIEQITDFDHVR